MLVIFKNWEHRNEVAKKIGRGSQEARKPGAKLGARVMSWNSGKENVFHSGREWLRAVCVYHACLELIICSAVHRTELFLRLE